MKEDGLKKRNPIYLAAQLALAGGLLLHEAMTDNKVVTFISGFLIGLSLIFKFYFYFKLRKDKA